MKFGFGFDASMPHRPPAKNGNSQEGFSLMNVLPQIHSLKGSRILLLPLSVLAFFWPALLSAQDVAYTASGVVSVIISTPPIYNGQYVLQTTDFGFFWLDTVSLSAGLVEAESKCGVGLPPSDSNFYVTGDCNGTGRISSSGSYVLVRQFNSQCAAVTKSCNGPPTTGPNRLTFSLGGGWRYLGNLGEIPDSTQTTDPQGRTWTVQPTDRSEMNFLWHASGVATPIPTPTPTAPPNAPPTAVAAATNLSAAGRTDKTNYYGDKWQLQDASTSGSPITNIDWDFNYTGSFQRDEGGGPSSEGTIAGYFPCDPSGPTRGDIRLGTNCISSLSLTNPASSGNYRFAEQSANQNGASASPFVSGAIAVVCPQANILGLTGYTGTCAKSGGTLNVLTGSNADASASQGNLAEASFAWSFTGPNPINASSAVVPVPAGATGFTLTITYPGGYQATASGAIVQASLVAAFALAPNPVLLNSTVTLTNQMRIAAGTTLNSVDYLVNPGACAAPPPMASNPLAASFLTVGGTAPVPAPPSVGGYCMYLRYNFTPSVGPALSQIVASDFTATDWVANPRISIDPLPVCGNTLCPKIGTTYSLSDSESIPLSPHPGAQWDLVSGSGTTSIGSSADATVPISWTPASACSSCSLRVIVSGVQASLPVNISNPVPTPPPTPIPTPVPTPPVGGSLSVALQGPTSGSKGTPLRFTAVGSGGVSPYTYKWQCDYNPLAPWTQLSQATCTYSTSGTHNVKVEVTDSVGSTAFSNDYFVTIAGLPFPSAGFSVSGATPNIFNGRYSAPTGAPVTFTANETNAASYSWDFGDGSSATTRTATHAFAAMGPHSVAMTVRGDEVNTSGSSSATINLDITPPTFRAVIVPGSAHLDDGTTTWSTDVSIFNGGTASMKISLAFVPFVADAVAPVSLDLTQLSYGSSVALGPGGSYSVGDVVAALNGGNNKGTLVVRYQDSTQAPLVTARVSFQPKVNPNDSSYGSGMPAYQVDGTGNISPQGFTSLVLSKSPGGVQTQSGEQALDSTLTVNLAGTGSGTVTSDPAGINCPTTCSFAFPVGTSVLLSPTASAGSTFAGITGCDNYPVGQCAMTMDASKTVTARFNGSSPTPTPTPTPPPPGNFTLSITKAGTGTGTVTSTPSGISCGTTCSAPFAQGIALALTAAPDSGSTFSGWGGACSGTGPCSVTLAADTSVSATFAASAPPPAAPQGGQVLIGLRSDPSYRFVITLFNASGSPGDFQLEAADDQGSAVQILDGSGNLVKFRRFTSLRPYQQIYLRDSDLGLADGRSYVLKATRTSAGGGALLAFGTALDRKTNDLVQISDDSQASQADANGSVSYWLAGVSRYDTTYGAHWRTDLRIFNRGSKRRNLDFEFSYTSDGVTEHVAHVYKVPVDAGTLLTKDDVVSALLATDTTVDLSGNSAGVLRISYPEDADSATQPLVIGSRNYDDQKTGTAGSQLAVYTSALVGSEGHNLFLTGAEDSVRYGSRIGVFAIDAGPVTGRIVAVGPDGSEVGSVGFVLGGSSPHYGQISLTDTSMNFRNPGTPVSIRIDQVIGGRVGAYAFTVDKVTLDTNFIQAVPQ